MHKFNDIQKYTKIYHFQLTMYNAKNHEIIFAVATLQRYEKIIE